MRIKLEATSVGIGTEKPLSGLVLKNLPLRSAILNFFRAYLVPGQLVNPGYATGVEYQIKMLNMCTQMYMTYVLVK